MRHTVQNRRKMIDWDNGKIQIPAALLINLAFLILALTIGFLRFEENDDSIISSIYANVWGTGYTEYAVYVNVLLGLIFKPFYAWKSTTNWYVLWNLAMCFLALTAISWLLLRRWGAKRGILVSIGFNLLFCWEHYCSFQYTKNAYLLIAAGFLLLLEMLFYESEKKKKLLGAVIGGVVLLFGCMLRISCLTAVAAFAGICMLGCFLRDKDTRRQTLVCLGILGFLILAAVKFEQWYYERDPEWAYYQEYNKLRTACLDYGLPSYDANQEIYEKAGFSHLEHGFLKWWVYADPEVFTLEALKQISEIQEKSGPAWLQVNENDVKRTVQEISDEAIYGIAVLLIWIYYMLAGKSASAGRKKIEILFLPLLILPLYWYLVSSGRVNHRAVYGIWFSAIAFLLFFAADIKPGKSKHFAIFIAILTVLGIPRWIGEAEMKSEHEWDQGYQELWFHMQMDTEHLYLLDTVTVVEGGIVDQSPLWTAGSGAKGNVYTLGGWQVPTPTTEAVLEKYGITNPFRALAEGNKQIILVDNLFVHDKVDYLRKNYNDKADLELIGEVGGFRLYTPVVSGE